MNFMREKLKPHIGHDIVCVAYGNKENPFDICIECENCGEVLVSAETFESGERTYIDMLDELHYAVTNDVIPEDDRNKVLDLIYELERVLEKYSA